MVGGIKDMKTIKVVAAVICDNIKEKNKIFATARGYGELKGGWEFPGGKVYRSLIVITFFLIFSIAMAVLLESLLLLSWQHL